jgi:hypothetical protein
MRHALVALCAVSTGLAANASQAAEWQVQRVVTPARVIAIETAESQVHVNAGELWYRVVIGGEQATLEFIDRAAEMKLPENALPDGCMAIGTGAIARAWLAELPPATTMAFSATRSKPAAW